MRFLAGKRHGAGSTPGGYSETIEAALGDAARQLRVGSRIVAVDAAPEDGDGEPARCERAPMGLAVDAAREAADHDDSERGEVTRQLARDLGAVRRAAAGADHGDRRESEDLRRTTAEMEPGRWIVELRQERWIPWAASRDGRMRHGESSGGTR